MSDDLQAALEPKSSITLSLLLLVISAFAWLYWGFVTQTIVSSLRETEAYSPTDDEFDKDLDNEILSAALGVRYPLFIAGILPLVAILGLMMGSTGKSGKIGKIASFSAVLLVAATVGMFIWAVIVLFKPISSIGDALDSQSGSEGSDLDTQQLASIRQAFNLIGMSCILLVVVALVGTSAVVVSLATNKKKAAISQAISAT